MTLFLLSSVLTNNYSEKSYKNEDIIITIAKENCRHNCHNRKTKYPWQNFLLKQLIHQPFCSI